MPVLRQLAAFGNGRSHTRISQLTSGDYEWRRGPGRLDHPRLRLPPASVLTALSSASARGVRFRTPVMEDEAEIYRTARPYSVAVALLAGREPATAFTALVHAVGRAVRGLHEWPPPDGFARVPPLLDELSNWLATGAGARDAARLHALVLDRLGAGRVAMLTGCCGELMGRCVEGSLLHGSLGIGQIVAAPGEAAGDLLVGPHVSTGPPEIDVGSFLGQLAELNLTKQSRFASTLGDVDCAALARAFTAGYGTGFDLSLTARYGLLTYLNHVRTFATYGTWHDDLAVSVDVIAELVDRGGIDLCTDFAGHEGQGR